jgi:hypothetical protein
MTLENCGRKDARFYRQKNSLALTLIAAGRPVLAGMSRQKDRQNLRKNHSVYLGPAGKIDGAAVRRCIKFLNCT